MRDVGIGVFVELLSEKTLEIAESWEVLEQTVS